MTTDYEKIVYGIANSAPTQAPALLRHAVENAAKKGAFGSDGGLLHFVCCTMARLHPPLETPGRRFAYSTDGECYSGDFASREEAIAEAAVHHEHFWTGQCVAPPQPEDSWDPEDWLEHVSVQDEYSHDYADGWDTSSKEDRDELRQLVRAIMANWLDRHGLRPQFYSILNPVEHQVVDGKVETIEEVGTDP